MSREISQVFCGLVRPCCCCVCFKITNKKLHDFGVQELNKEEITLQTANNLN